MKGVTRSPLSQGSS